MGSILVKNQCSVDRENSLNSGFTITDKRWRHIFKNKIKGCGISFNIGHLISQQYVYLSI